MRWAATAAALLFSCGAGLTEGKRIRSAQSEVVANIDFNEIADIDGFTVDYDWTMKADPTLSASRVSVIDAPGGGTALRMFLGENDLTFSPTKPNTEPRTEIGINSLLLDADVTYAMQVPSAFFGIRVVLCVALNSICLLIA